MKKKQKDCLKNCQFTRFPLKNLKLNVSITDMPREFSFYNELKIVKTSKPFKAYARSYSIETIDSQDPSVQLKNSKLSTIDLLKDLIVETKGFKYQITQNVLISKYKEITDREFAPIYFNFTTKTVIAPKYCLDSSFQGIFNRTDNCISQRHG